MTINRRILDDQKRIFFYKIRMNCDEMSPFWESNFLGGGSARIPKSLVMKSQEGTTKGLRGPKNHILGVVLITVCGGGVGRNGWPCAAG